MKKGAIGIVFAVLTWTVNASDLVVKKSTEKVDVVVQKIENVIAAKKGLNVFTVIDHQKAADRVGMKLSETKVILFGNPKMGTLFMQKDHLTALDLPLKILVYADNGVTKIVYRDPKAWSTGFDLEDFNPLNKMGKVLDMITTKAIP